MKKICFFTNSMFKIGGEQRITSLIANELVKNKYDVTIIIKNKEDINYNLYNLSKKIKIINLNYTYDFRLNNYRLFDKLRILNRKYGIFKYNKRIIRSFFCSNRMIKDLKNIFTNNKYDVVIGVAGDRSFILSYLKKYISGKLFFWNHMNFDTHFINKNSRYYNEEIFIKPLINNFDNIIVLNKDDSIKFKKYYNANSIVIKNCKSFISKKKSRLSNNKFIACGRLVEQKGFDKLIDIMTIFNKYNKEYKLDIYGNGPLKDYLLKKIIDNNMEDYINIYDNNDNIKDVLLGYDIFLNSSLYEGFGLVTLEALECGLPVIGFDIPANKDLIIDKKTGYLIPSYDINKYAKCLLKMISNKEILSEMQLNIPSTIDKYNIKEIIKEWIKIIE